MVCKLRKGDKMTIHISKELEWDPFVKKVMDKFKKLDEKSDKNMESISYKFELVFKELKEIKKKVK